MTKMFPARWKLFPDFSKARRKVERLSVPISWLIPLWKKPLVFYIYITLR
jgi:hypothetical protein